MTAAPHLIAPGARVLIVAAARETAWEAHLALGCPRSKPLTTNGGDRAGDGLHFDEVVWVAGWWAGARAREVERAVRYAMAKRPGRVIEHEHFDPYAPKGDLMNVPAIGGPSRGSLFALTNGTALVLDVDRDGGSIAVSSRWQYLQRQGGGQMRVHLADGRGCVVEARDIIAMVGRHPEDLIEHDEYGNEIAPTAGRFRKKPVEIEARNFFAYTLALDGEPLYDWLVNGGADFELRQEDPGPAYLTIHTLEGVMRVDVGDWIIKGVKGEFYPCKPDIFEATYDAVEDDAPAIAEGA